MTPQGGVCDLMHVYNPLMRQPMGMCQKGNRKMGGLSLMFHDIFKVSAWLDSNTPGVAFHEKVIPQICLSHVISILVVNDARYAVQLRGLCQLSREQSALMRVCVTVCEGWGFPFGWIVRATKAPPSYILDSCFFLSNMCVCAPRTLWPGLPSANES